MAKIAVVKAGGKQYLVRENQELVVDKLDGNKDDKVSFEALAVFDDASEKIEVGEPALKTAVEAQIVEQVKGDKVRVAKFKAKVRYRKVNGFRAELTRVKILGI